jgi:hypothetical protein
MKDTKSINVRASTSNTKEVILAMTVDSSGKMLPHFLMLKGASNRQKASHEFGMYPESSHYACQKGLGWMRR